MNDHQARMDYYRALDLLQKSGVYVASQEELASQLAKWLRTAYEEGFAFGKAARSG